MTNPKAQVPTPGEVVGKGVQKLIDLRPGSFRHVNYGRGRYASVIAGWRAQAALMCRRLADMAKNGRLEFAEGQPLTELVASEFEALAQLDATAAVGQVVLTRGAGRVGGAIRRGSRFTRPADASSLRLYGDAQYTCAVDTHVPYGATQIEVPIEAVRPGSFANRPFTGTVQTELQIADDIVDRTGWTVQSYEVGGGSDGVTEADIKRYAAAYSRGQYGPIPGAALAGALAAGAKHAIGFDDPTVGAHRLYVADSSWAGSTRWAKLIRQDLTNTKSVGFGCKVLVGFVENQIVAINAVVRLRDSSAMAETSALETAIQSALRSYFDDRPDFNRWKTSALRGVIARADRRILSCPSCVVKTFDGDVLSEPPPNTPTHFLLLDNSVRIEFQSPV